MISRIIHIRIAQANRRIEKQEAAEAAKWKSIRARERDFDGYMAWREKVDGAPTWQLQWYDPPLPIAASDLSDVDDERDLA